MLKIGSGVVGAKLDGADGAIKVVGSFAYQKNKIKQRLGNYDFEPGLVRFFRT